MRNKRDNDSYLYVFWRGETVSISDELLKQIVGVDVRMDQLRLSHSAVVSARDLNIEQLRELPAPSIRCKENEDIVQKLYQEVASRETHIANEIL